MTSVFHHWSSSSTTSNCSQFSGGCDEGSALNLWHSPALPHPTSMSKVWGGFGSQGRLHLRKEMCLDSAPDLPPHSQQCSQTMASLSWNTEIYSKSDMAELWILGRDAIGWKDTMLLCWGGGKMLIREDHRYMFIRRVVNYEAVPYWTTHKHNPSNRLSHCHIHCD